MKILIADDHAVLRKGLIQILADAYTDALFGETSTVSETLDSLSQHVWDVVVLDIFMPGRGGLDALYDIRRLYPRLPVLVLSSAPEAQMATRVLRAGASGYLNKQAAPEELVCAIRRVCAGGRYVSEATAEHLAGTIGRGNLAPHDTLSDREVQVLQLLMAGKTVKDIAHELSLSPKTVSTYHMRLWDKLHVQNDVELIRYAILHELGHSDASRN